MVKAVNRYLNLAGAPYTPNKPKATITLANSFTAVATGLTIFGAAYVNPTVEKNHLIYFGEGALGSTLALYFCRKRRRDEAEKLSSGSHQLVIDTAPDKSTPPTSEAILSRALELKSRYNTHSSSNWYTLSAASYDLGLAAFDATLLLSSANPYFYAFFMSYFATKSVDIFTRNRQLNKILDLKWTVTDQGNAIRSFQKDEVTKLANSPQAVKSPISPL